MLMSALTAEHVRALVLLRLSQLNNHTYKSGFLVRCSFGGAPKILFKGKNLFKDEKYLKVRFI
jgi:hypothetical protein